MFDKLIDLFVDFIDLFRFYQVTDHYEEMVVLRFGKFNRILEPGFHWIWPMGIESVLTDIVKPTTHNLHPQSLTTADGVSVVVSGIITRTITDIQTALLECEGVETVITDSAYGVIATMVRNARWEDLQSDEFCSEVKSQIHKRTKEYGVTVKRFQWSDIARARSVRLWNISGQHVA